MTLIKTNQSYQKPAVFNSFLDRFFNDDFFGKTQLKNFTPAVDIAETDKEFELHFQLPGLKKEEISIDVHDDRITISGERKFENEKKDKNFHTVESFYGTFSRSFYLPDSANTEKVEATYTNGILSVVIPKDVKKESKRTITIR